MDHTLDKAKQLSATLYADVSDAMMMHYHCNHVVLYELTDCWSCRRAQNELRTTPLVKPIALANTLTSFTA
jgi:hypothetical protein